jgi:hypothetical protein
MFNGNACRQTACPVSAISSCPCILGHQDRSSSRAPATANASSAIPPPARCLPAAVVRPEDRLLGNMNEANLNP